MAEPDGLSAVDWLRARRVLALELVALAATAAALAELAPRAEAAVPDARALYVGAFALFSVAFLRALFRALELFDWDCPRCRENYCGPFLFRARCHSCGSPASAEGRRSPERR